MLSGGNEAVNLLLSFGGSGLGAQKWNDCPHQCPNKHGVSPLQSID
jgi:hypothetical protein